MSNAINHARSKIEIRVGFSLRKGALYVVVTDDGRGISDNEIKSIFLPLNEKMKEMRALQGWELKTRGIGLGLFVSKRIVEHLHGSLTVNSYRGRQTIFKLVLPCLDFQKTRVRSRSSLSHSLRNRNINREHRNRGLEVI